MDAVFLRSQLAHQADAIRGLTAGVSPEMARRRPAQEQWSMLEVVNHLGDEEVEDFRAHLGQALAADGQTWRPIDPQGWAAARQYNRRDWATSLEQFLAERRRSLHWLEGLGEADWQQSIQAPWGAVRAGDLLAAWAMHDCLHIRQLVELRRELLLAECAPYRVEYAGDW
ncbi:MAG: DinB family protein [Chloroflexi bacterium]|jgi:hypothetical protein|nr:DinB family protein [Anaerolineaceae bacterium]NMB90064.1 DinB family protein [Chloroflexota bacterium]